MTKNFKMILTKIKNLFEKYTKDDLLFYSYNSVFLNRLTEKIMGCENIVLKIGITGESGVGKSFFTDNASDYLTEKYKIIPAKIKRDEYLKDYSDKILEYGNYNNFSKSGGLEGDCEDFDRLILDIEKLSKGGKVHPKKRHRETGVIEEFDMTKIIHPSKIIMMEGIGIFHNKKLLDTFDIKIYIDAPDNIISNRWGRRSPARGKLGEVAKSSFIITRDMAKKYTVPYKKDSDIILNAESDIKNLKNFIDELHKIISPYCK